MLADIRPWCTGAFQYERSCYIPPAIFGLLLDGEADSEDEFIQRAMEKIDPTPKNLYVPFNPPVFPFDNRDFEDPFYLVENGPGDIIDLKYLKDLTDEQLNGYLKDIFVRFSYKSEGGIKVKRKELLHYAGKNFYLGIKKGAQRQRAGSRKKKKSFLTEKTRSTAAIHIPETTRRSIIRRRVHRDNAIIRDDDVVNLKRCSRERADVLVAIDSSTSMEQGGKLQSAMKACLSFHYYRGSRNARVEFVSFNDKIEKIAPLDILTLKPVGMTHTAELLDFVSRYFSRRGGDTNELYIITDGYPQRAGVEDAEYLSVTLKMAIKLRHLHINTKTLLVHAPNYELNPNNFMYNRLICESLGGELVRVDADDLSSAMIGRAVN
ncbi:vWA domain-containing protein [Candidatus Magnetominusculus dajiuhuensis]|uniref:vWA domain-containing protein n=1 Tax=Candidatus Magnetominusculus dajiuhuensis TaxID=3137712 RepID=UPI003B43696F